jgi:hypothetical protein
MFPQFSTNRATTAANPFDTYRTFGAEFEVHDTRTNKVVAVGFYGRDAAQAECDRLWFAELTAAAPRCELCDAPATLVGEQWTCQGCAPSSDDAPDFLASCNAPAVDPADYVAIGRAWDARAEASLRDYETTQAGLKTFASLPLPGKRLLCVLRIGPAFEAAKWSTAPSEAA